MIEENKNELRDHDHDHHGNELNASESTAALQEDVDEEVLVLTAEGREGRWVGDGFTEFVAIGDDTGGELAFVLEYSVDPITSAPETFRSSITKLYPNGDREIVVGPDDGLEAANGLTFGADGTLYVANKSTNNFNEITNNGQGQVIQINDPKMELDDTVIVASINNFAVVDYQPILANPEGDGFTNYDARGFKRVYTPGKSSILKYDNEGNFAETLIPAGTEDENISAASGLALGPDQLLYIIDTGTNSVKKFNIEGEFMGYFLKDTLLDTPEEIVFGYDGSGEYSVYLSSLTGDGVKRYDWETGEELFHIDTALTPSREDAVENPDGTVDLSAALMDFGPDGNLYIGAVFSDNSILKYNPQTNEVSEFISQDDGAQLIPSGMAFDDEGNLYNGTFSGPTFGLPPTTIAQYDADGNLINPNFVDNSGGELDIASRVRLYDFDFDGEETFYVSNFGGDSILSYEGPESDQPGAFNGNFLADSGEIPVLLLSSRDTGEVKAYDEDGNFVTNFVTADSAGEGIPANPDGFVEVDNEFYLASTLSGDILKYDATGDFLEFFMDGGDPDNDALVAPIDMVLSTNGEKLYVANFASSEDLPVPPTNQDSILVYDLATGTLESEFEFTNGNEGPLGLTLDSTGEYLYVGTFADGVWKFATDSGIGERLIDKTEFIEGDRGSIAAGVMLKDDESLLVADFYGAQILDFDISDPASIPSGEQFINTIGNGLFTPTAVEMSPDGDIFVNGAFSSNVARYDGETGNFIETVVDTNEGGVEGTNFGLDFGEISPLKNPGGLIYASESEISIPVDITGAPEFVIGTSFFNIAIEFGEMVTGFELADIMVENGTVSNLLEIDGDSYIANIIPDGNGDITINIPGGAVMGENNNTNFAAPPVIVGFESLPKLITGTPSADEFDSAFPDEKLFVGDNQTLFTGGGNDYVDVSEVGSKNRIDTGSGDDIVFAGTRNRIKLGRGDDILFAGSGQGANLISLGAGKDQLWLVEDDNAIPPNPNSVSDFNPDDDMIGLMNTGLSFGQRGEDTWDYQQMGTSVAISIFGQQIGELLNTNVSDLSENNFMIS